MSVLDLDTWARLSDSERLARAQRLAAQLPMGFAFRAVRRFALGDQAQHVALFDYERAEFALVPGGSVELGFDLARAWQPLPDEAHSWSSSQHPLPKDYVETEAPFIVAQVTGRPRRCELAACLVETRAVEVGWAPASLEDEHVANVIAWHQKIRPSSGKKVPIGCFRLTNALPCVRTSLAADGALVVEVEQGLTQQQISQRFAAASFCLPSPDEWEHAISGGARSLFRWGDHVPCDRYPHDTAAKVIENRQIELEEAAADEDWVIPPCPYEPDWELHRVPNAFGIHGPATSLTKELTSDPGVTRGGDAGNTIGDGFFLAWLTLASACEEDSSRRDPAAPIEIGCTRVRRVLSLR